jgi:predicted RNA-binding Zn-ribbon protein involved in translation (DUF1610 family)
MSDVKPANVFLCTQCGGELHPDEGQIFLTCPYCNSTVYVDKSQVVFHWYLTPTLDEAKARASLARWMAGNQTVKDLDKKATLLSTSFEYFPVWFFKQERTGDKEELLLVPAAATSVTELRHLNLPAGDLQKYDPTLDSQAHPPTVPLEAAISWLQGRNLQSDQFTERALVHLPIYTFKYSYQNQVYTALVEAATGNVFANIFPAKAESPYQLVGMLTAAIFLCLATFPVLGGIWGWSGSGIGLMLCLGISFVVAPLLLAFTSLDAASMTDQKDPPRSGWP